MLGQACGRRAAIKADWEWARDQNRFSMQISCSLPGNVWMFHRVMSSLQNSWRRKLHNRSKPGFFLPHAWSVCLSSLLRWAIASASFFRLGIFSEIVRDLLLLLLACLLVFLISVLLPRAKPAVYTAGATHMFAEGTSDGKSFKDTFSCEELRQTDR